jgi:hypothetical protein
LPPPVGASSVNTPREQSLQSPPALAALCDIDNNIDAALVNAFVLDARPRATTVGRPPCVCSPFWVLTNRPKECGKPTLDRPSPAANNHGTGATQHDSRKQSDACSSLLHHAALGRLDGAHVRDAPSVDERIKPLERMQQSSNLVSRRATRSSLSANRVNAHSTLRCMRPSQ